MASPAFPQREAQERVQSLQAESQNIDSESLLRIAPFLHQGGATLITIRCAQNRIPCPSFPCCFCFLGVFPAGNFLVFLTIFFLSSMIFQGSRSEDNPCIFEGFPWYFRKDQGKKNTEQKPHSAQQGGASLRDSLEVSRKMGPPS